MAVKHSILARLIGSFAIFGSGLSSSTKKGFRFNTTLLSGARYDSFQNSSFNI